jgi:hypothetical protein
MGIPQFFHGVKLCNIPSGMGGVFPAAICSDPDDKDNVQVVCLHSDYFTNWVLSVKVADIKPLTYQLSEEMKNIILSRVR